MKNQVSIWMSCVIFILLVSLQTTSQAKQQELDLTICFAGTCDNLSESEDMETESCESQGIGWSNNDFEQLETFTTFEKCILGIKGDKWDMDCFVKFLDSDGDHIVFRNKIFYGGTGKWKEAAGSYKTKQIRRGKSMPPNHFALCAHVNGTLSLPD